MLKLEISLKIRLVAQALFDLGKCYGKKGNKEKAGELFNKSLEIITKIFGENHPKFFSIRNAMLKYNIETSPQ